VKRDEGVANGRYPEVAVVQEDDQGSTTRRVVCHPGQAPISALVEASGCQPASRAEAYLLPDGKGEGWNGTK